MTFSTEVARGLAEGRVLAEALMTDTCTITRAGAGAGAGAGVGAGVGPFNESTGQYDPPPRITVYTGKCRIQIKSAVASSADSSAGDRLGTVQDRELQLPITGTADVSIDDVAEVTAAVSDASLVGRKFTVTERHEKSQATARRLRVRQGSA